MYAKLAHSSIFAVFASFLLSFKNIFMGEKREMETAEFAIADRKCEKKEMIYDLQ